MRSGETVLSEACDSVQSDETVLSEACDSVQSDETVLSEACDSVRSGETVLSEACDSVRSGQTVLSEVCDSVRSDETVLGEACDNAPGSSVWYLNRAHSAEVEMGSTSVWYVAKPTATVNDDDVFVTGSVDSPRGVAGVGEGRRQPQSGGGAETPCSPPTTGNARPTFLFRQVEGELVCDEDEETDGQLKMKCDSGHFELTRVSLYRDGSGEGGGVGGGVGRACRLSQCDGPTDRRVVDVTLVGRDPVDGTVSVAPPAALRVVSGGRGLCDSGVFDSLTSPLSLPPVTPSVAPAQRHAERPEAADNSMLHEYYAGDHTDAVTPGGVTACTCRDRVPLPCCPVAVPVTDSTVGDACRSSQRRHTSLSGVTCRNDSRTRHTCVSVIDTIGQCPDRCQSDDSHNNFGSVAGICDGVSRLQCHIIDDASLVTTPGDMSVVTTPGDMSVVTTPGDASVVTTLGDTLVMTTRDDASVVTTPGDVSVVTTPGDASRLTSPTSDMRQRWTSGGTLTRHSSTASSSRWVEGWRHVRGRAGRFHECDP